MILPSWNHGVPRIEVGIVRVGGGDGVLRPQGQREEITFMLNEGMIMGVERKDEREEEVTPTWL
jgi:hypothetical protein